jgi:glycosyltransferase involved in cell wall biosynthesis
MNLVANRLVIVYLGRKGGGNHLTLHIIRELMKNDSIKDLTVVIYKNNYLLKQYLLLKGCRLIILKSRVSSIFGLRREFKQDITYYETSHAIFTMPSPFDAFTSYFFQKRNYKIVRIIHDARKHPGDLWPWNFWIKHMVKSAYSLITPSGHVASEVLRLYGRDSIVYNHPVFDLDSYGPSAISLPSEFTLLYVGRIRKYKGIDNLIAAFKLLPDHYSVKLLIAGEGKFHYELPKNCLLVNRWLNEREIKHLIESAEVVIFPYTEASQSGLLPIVVNKSRKVVLTPLPGLIDQVKDYKAAYVSDDFTPNSISLQIQRALDAPNNHFIKHDYNLPSFAEVFGRIISLGI